MNVEGNLWKAVEKGDAVEVSKIVSENPDIDVNWAPEGEDILTPLYLACRNGHHGIVATLLKCPGINVNASDIHGDHPLAEACCRGHVECVRLLLNDRRTVLTQDVACCGTPFFLASLNGHLSVIQWWIASGRETGQDPEDSEVAVKEGRHKGRHKLASLLEKFRAHPGQTRREVRKEIGWYGVEVEIFALMIFSCDGLLDIKRQGKYEEATRFFKIASRLPMELQTILCHRVAGSMGDNILSEERENAFKVLARALVC